MIVTELWTPDPDRPGYLKRERTRTVHEVRHDCEAALEAAELLGDMEYFDSYPSYVADRTPWPSARWTAVFPVAGSEGHYIHVEAIGLPGEMEKRRLVLVGKTFGGLEHAMRIANTLTQAFYG